MGARIHLGRYSLGDHDHIAPRTSFEHPWLGGLFAAPCTEVHQAEHEADGDLDGAVRASPADRSVAQPIHCGQHPNEDSLLKLEWIDRYGRKIDFVDPPHQAKVRLTGTSVRFLRPGKALTAPPPMGSTEDETSKF